MKTLLNHFNFYCLGVLFGDTFIVKQMLPLLKNVVRCCIKFSSLSKPEPMQSWSSLALIDCFTTLDGLVAYLPGEVVLKELIEVRFSNTHRRSCMYELIFLNLWCLPVVM